MHGLPYMECRKDEMWQIFIADGRMFPLHTGCVAEVLICDSFYKTEVCETTICVIKECNPDGRWRFVCLEVTGNEVSCIYESPFLYDERIEADDCYSVSYYENGVLKEFYIKE